MSEKHLQQETEDWERAACLQTKEVFFNHCDEGVFFTFVSRTDIIRSLASLTFSLFPHTLMCGSGKERRHGQTLKTRRTSVEICYVRARLGAHNEQRQNATSSIQIWHKKSPLVNKLQCVGQKLCDSNCRFYICRVSFSLASKCHVVIGEEEQLWNYIQAISRNHELLKTKKQDLELQFCLNRRQTPSPSLFWTSFCQPPSTSFSNTVKDHLTVFWCLLAVTPRPSGVYPNAN